MNSLWNSQEAERCANDPLAMRVYSSRLLGQEPMLVMHGGGNTSVKATVTNLFGDEEEILYVKGSGGDLATIEAGGFAPVRLSVLQRMAQLETLSDPDMVAAQRAAMLDPSAPNPSVEALLHAIIPSSFVDHTHADAVVTVTNTEQGEARIREIYGDRVMVIPYVMPGFLLARHVHALTQQIDWSRYEGMILLHHGVFTYGDNAHDSYERMIRLVSEAETYLAQQGITVQPTSATASHTTVSHEELIHLARVRRAVSAARGKPVLARLETDAAAAQFAALPNVADLATRGPITPDHIIRTKRAPVILGSDPEEDVAQFAEAYESYFTRHADGQARLDAAPRWAVWPGRGTIAFGCTTQEVQTVSDITHHTMRAMQWGEALGGWRPLPERALFDMEYWVLEQAKLATARQAPVLQGKAALVTGGASGIGKACVELLRSQGAVVAALDINPDVATQYAHPGILGVVCDVTDQAQLRTAIHAAIQQFGGLDILISNAGIFPESQSIAEMTTEIWQRSLAVNLSSHQLLLQACIPLLLLGLEPAVVIIASKNVLAPGPGASAYSVAKAGLTQLARVAALELGAHKIRVNVIHPNQVFDTALWTPDVLAQRAQQYGMSVEEYKTNNLLKVEVRSTDVAQLACAMAGPLFAKTTGSQVAVDGGNDRVI